MLKHYLAFDLGAESGRAILGSYSGAGLSLEELHRFPNTPVRTHTGLYWDVFRLFHEIQQGLAIAERERKLDLSGIGVDTWGVDFGLVGRDGALIACPMHYRDARNDGMLEKTFAVIPREEIFAETGIQFMQLNSLYQLHAMKLAGSPALDAAATLLFMPDLFNYWLTGRQAAEMTIASTSQFYNTSEKRWVTGILDRLGLPTRLLPEVVTPGTNLGPLVPHLCEETDLGRPPVFATACHDTASAVAAEDARDVVAKAVVRDDDEHPVGAEAAPRLRNTRGSFPSVIAKASSSSVLTEQDLRPGGTRAPRSPAGQSTISDLFVI